MTEVFEGNEQDFSEKTSKGVWLIKFFADWCGPCSQTKTPFDAHVAGSAHEGLEVDVEANGNVAVAFNVLSIPTVVVLRDGEEVGL